MNKLQKYIGTLIIVFLGLLIFPKNTNAIVDPLTSANNKFGIHINDENDLPDASALVNSSGGDWGYVTLVIREDERNTVRWQRAFDKMRSLHLIPIVRVATKQADSNWEKPTYEEIENWVNFFNSLNWVVQNRYVVVGNEVNHAAEWGGEINPGEYANYLDEFSQSLKNTSDDYFILPAALDASAPNKSGQYMSESEFLTEMYNTIPAVFDAIDGWNSHSYPNPGFMGNPDDTGPGSVRTFEWELAYLHQLGVNRDLPIFITETGWVHNTPDESDALPPDSVGENLAKAFSNAWDNTKIVAVTPFILNYPGEPFSKFSWKDTSGRYYEFFNKVQSLVKKSGKPVQINTAEVVWSVKSNYFSKDDADRGFAVIENKGQSIWQDSETVDINGQKLFIVNVYKKQIFPGEKGFFAYYFPNHVLTLNLNGVLLFN